MPQSFDFAIIGGGPGGYVAAVRAAQLGFSVVLVEREHLGGICLNWGCIPTKALLRSAEIHDMLGHAHDFGITVGSVDFDLAAIVKRSRAVAGQLTRGIAHLMKKNKITVIDGVARLAGQGRLTITLTSGGHDNLTAEHIVIATGARARQLPGLETDGDRVWTYKEAMVPKSLPKSLLVVGSGAIGIEFASFYRSLGSEVTVVEVVDRILPVEDEEISGIAAKQLAKRGIQLLTGATLKTLDRRLDSLLATVETGGTTSSLSVDAVIMAVGITGNTEDLGLKEAGVQVKRGHIVIDAFCRTAAQGVYAIGDVTGPPWLAHKASHEGVLCIEKIAGIDGVHPLDTSKIPGCTYCQPQVASVGLSESAARAKGYKIRVGRFPFIGNGKAIALGEPEGLIKTVFDDATGELLGAHMVGTEVTELIQGYAIARQMEATELDLMQTIFPHPTLSEMLHESVLDAYDRAIHV